MVIRLVFRPRYILDRNWKIKPAINKRVISGSRLDSVQTGPDMENDIPPYTTMLNAHTHTHRHTCIYCTYKRTRPLQFRLLGWTNFTAIQTTKNGLFGRGGRVGRRGEPFICEPITHKSLTTTATVASGHLPFSAVVIIVKKDSISAAMCPGMFLYLL